MNDDQINKDAVYINEAEAAAILKVPTPTLAYWRRSGKAPRHLKLSRKVTKYLKSDVEAFLQARIVEERQAA